MLASFQFAKDGDVAKLSNKKISILPIFVIQHYIKTLTMETIIKAEPPIKESWSKPELTVIGVAENTLGSVLFGSDHGTYS
jgi:hypothetical protein